MNLSEYTAFDGLGLAELVSRGEVSAAELESAALRALAAVNPQINAVVEHWPSEVDPAGRAPLGAAPFHGVPFLVKDLGVSMAGKRGEFGSRLAKGSVAPADTTLMRRFREAGLVTLGRTNCPEMAISTTTEPVLHGATRNPWNLALTPGGSSGGAAAAVAAGIVPLAHANDAGGSIRVPAALCGLFGMKPTRGRVSNGPDLDEVFSGLGVQLGVSRTVRDSAALLDAIAGVEVGEPYSTAPPARTFLSEVGRDPGELRIGVMTRAWNGAWSEPAVQEAALAAARHCESLGHHVETTSLDLGVDWDAFIYACAQIIASHLVAWIDAIAAGTGRPADASTLEPATLTCYRYGRAARAADLVGALAIRNLVTRHVGQFFTRYDVLLTPTLPALSLPLGKYNAEVESLDGPGWLRRVFDHSPFTPLFNMAGTPAMSVPLAEDAATRLPIGVQFAAGFGREDQLFRLAGQLERTLPWAGRRAAVWAGAQEVVREARQGHQDSGGQSMRRL